MRLGSGEVKSSEVLESVKIVNLHYVEGIVAEKFRTDAAALRQKSPLLVLLVLLLLRKRQLGDAFESPPALPERGLLLPRGIGRVGEGVGLVCHGGW